MPLSPTEQADLLRAEMDRQGVSDPELRAGIAAIAMGESAFHMRPEQGYSGTLNTRIRTIFGSRVDNLLQSQLSALKVNDVGFFNHVYGGEWGALHLGNIEPGDGFKFRGRGMFQLTGRDNYERYGKMIGKDLVTDPEIADDPKIACAIAVAYMRDRYKGGGWPGMKRAVGNNVGDIEANKDRLFSQYMRSGEFALKVPAPAPLPPEQVVAEFKAAVERVQTFLHSKGLYNGPIDGDFGEGSHSALRQYLIERQG